MGNTVSVVASHQQIRKSLLISLMANDVEEFRKNMAEFLRINGYKNEQDNIPRNVELEFRYLMEKVVENDKYKIVPAIAESGVFKISDYAFDLDNHPLVLAANNGNEKTFLALCKSIKITSSVSDELFDKVLRTALTHPKYYENIEAYDKICQAIVTATGSTIRNFNLENPPLLNLAREVGSQLIADQLSHLGAIAEDQKEQGEASPTSPGAIVVNIRSKVDSKNKVTKLASDVIPSKGISETRI